jgi:hypothetical protein
MSGVHMSTNLARNSRARSEILFLIFIVCMLAYSQAYVPAHAGPQGAEIELSLSQLVLRGDIMVVSGRLSTTLDNRPIPLVKVHLQYHRSEDSYFTREVTIFTSNPGGLFEDRFNTTSLLRIGTWFVNASFPSQTGYENTSALASFTIVVQPALSLYVSSHDIELGQKVVFNGLLFACIPCIQDQVAVIFTRPDNTSVTMDLRVTPIGGPYPGGFYNGTFSPDTRGRWQVRAIWKGNDVMLPTHSQTEEFNVGTLATGFDLRTVFAFAAIALVSIVSIALLRLRISHKKPVS